MYQKELFFIQNTALRYQEYYNQTLFKQLENQTNESILSQNEHNNNKCLILPVNFDDDYKIQYVTPGETKTYMQDDETWLNIDSINDDNAYAHNDDHDDDSSFTMAICA